jgi:uncharacterized protein (TIRG00374 family)
MTTEPEQVELELDDGDDDDMPRVQITREHMLIFGLFVVSAIAFLYFVLPKLAGLSDTWDRIGDGDPWWLALAFLFEVCSFGGYIVLFRTVFEGARVDWRESYQITMAGLAATRLFAAAGAGGVALTAWALRRSGMQRRTVADRMIAFMVVLYVVYAGALVVFGFGLDAGVFSGPAPFGFTVVPAIFGTSCFLILILVSLLPRDAERLVDRYAESSESRVRTWARRLASVPASASAGARIAMAKTRDREVGLLGAVAWWGFDLAVLWACFHAFGDPPPLAPLVMGYFVGMIANTLPLPGGIGGVEGGMIGTLVAFDVSGGLAVVAVLAYRGFSFWLPTIPGAVAYVQLRRTVARWKEERHPSAVAVEA